MPARDTAVVVGAPGAIAESIAALLAADGHPVASVGFRFAARAGDGRAFDTPRDGEGWRSLIAEIASAQGPPLVLVDVASFPAGYGQPDGAHSYVGEVLARAEASVSAARPLMAQARSGSVVLVGLPMGSEAVVGIPAAGALAGALPGLVRGLAVEMGDDGIRVNLVSPGLIRLARINESQRPGDGFGIVPLRRPGTDERAGSPVDVAAAVAFLASADAGYITGTQLVVDGGLSPCRNSRASAFWEDGATDAFERSAGLAVVATASPQPAPEH